MFKGLFQLLMKRIGNTQNAVYSAILCYPTTTYSGVFSENWTVFDRSVTSVLPLINAPFSCYAVWLGSCDCSYRLILCKPIQNGLYHLITHCQVLSHPLSVSFCYCHAKALRCVRLFFLPVMGKRADGKTL